MVRQVTQGSNLERFEPDWSSLWTGPQAEIALVDFKFSGPGWYYTKENSLLVVPAYGAMQTIRSVKTHWAQQGWPEDQLFRFYVWNGDERPTAAFNAILNAPTRQCWPEDRPLEVGHV